ncbi:MAG: MmcQ/YjbR family DNA-binding protein, partial [Acidobacteria bacterium]
MTADDFRRIALGLEGAIEAVHMGHPDFRINGRIFA